MKPSDIAKRARHCRAIASGYSVLRSAKAGAYEAAAQEYERWANSASIEQFNEQQMLGQAAQDRD